MNRVDYSPLDRGMTPEYLAYVAERLERLALDLSKPAWLRELAAMKAVEARAFARVAAQ